MQSTVVATKLIAASTTEATLGYMIEARITT